MVQNKRHATKAQQFTIRESKLQFELSLVQSQLEKSNRQEQLLSTKSEAFRQQCEQLNQRLAVSVKEVEQQIIYLNQLQLRGRDLPENVLDCSGLQLGRDYERAVSFKTKNGQFRPMY